MLGKMSINFSLWKLTKKSFSNMFSRYFLMERIKEILVYFSVKGFLEEKMLVGLMKNLNSKLHLT